MLELLDLTLKLLIAIIVAWLSQFMMIFLVLVPDSRNILAAVPTAKVSAWKTVELVPKWYDSSRGGVSLSTMYTPAPTFSFILEPSV